MAIDTSVQGFTGFYEPPPQEAPVSTRDFLRGFLRGAQAGAASREFKKAKEELEAINRSREEGGFEALGPQGRTAFENRTGFSPDILENRRPPGAVQGILGAALGPDLQAQEGQLNQLAIAREQRQSQLASRQFAAQDAYRNAVERDLAQAEAEAQAHGGTVDDETRVRIAAKHYLRYGATMGPGFGGSLGGMISTGQRAATAEMTAEHRRGLLEAREKELNLSRDRLDEMSKQRDLDRQQKQTLQDQKDAVDRELSTARKQIVEMTEAGKGERQQIEHEFRERIEAARIQARKDISEGLVSREQWLNRHLNQTVDDIGKSRAGSKLTPEERTARALKILSDAWDSEVQSKRSTPQADSAPGNVPTITNKSDYDKLPPKTRFRGADGKLYVKP